MSNNPEEFKSYAPVVGRMKSKRWVQASNPSYDGDDWGDEYDEYEDEEEPPEMPAIPQQYLEKEEAVDIDKPLQLGTSGEKLQKQKSNASTSSQKAATTTTNNTTTEDSTGEVVQEAEANQESESAPRARSPSQASSRSWGAASSSEDEQQKQTSSGDQEPSSTSSKPAALVGHGTREPIRDASVQSFAALEEVAYPEEAVQHGDHIGDTSSNNALPEGVEVPELPAVPNHQEESVVSKHLTEKATESTSSSPVMDKSTANDEDKGDQSDIDDIFDCYTSDHDTPELDQAEQQFVTPATGVQMERVLSQEGSQASGAAAAGSTEEKEKAITGDDHDDESADHVDDHVEPSKPQGRWKPLPGSVITSSKKTDDSAESSVPASAQSYTSQDRLEKEIMGSFGEEGNTAPNSLRVPPPIQGSAANRESVDETHVDPEMLELYKNTSNFLQGDYSADVEPLATTKSHGSMDEETHHQQHMPSSPKAVPADADDQFSESEDEDEELAKQEEPSQQPHDGGGNESDLDGDQVSVVSDISRGSGVSGSTTGKPSTGQFQSMIIPETDEEKSKREDRDITSPQVDVVPRQFSSSSGAAAPAAPRIISSPMLSRKPPKFDFTGILSKGRPEDRKYAFDDARQRELEFDSGLQAWLREASTSAGPGVYTTGKPPPPTDNEKQLSAPSRTMSSTFIRPAKHVVNSNVVNKVGEKSSKKAKSLFARGKKLLN